jgi:predicted small secreted protein
MKKFILPIFAAILIGVIIGKYLFSQYEGKIDAALKNDETIYVLQQGVYSNLDNAKNAAGKLNYYVIDKDDKYYRIYVAITYNQNNVSKLEEYYVSKGNDIYVRELKTDNPEFLDLLKQYDLLLESSSGDNELLQIEKQILTNYEELILKNE